MGGNRNNSYHDINCYNNDIHKNKRRAEVTFLLVEFYIDIRWLGLIQMEGWGMKLPLLEARRALARRGF